MLFELINLSDPYTFEAPSIEIAGVCASQLSPAFGAKSLETGETTPLLFGWDEWLQERKIDEVWCSEHLAEVADAYDSFLIGSASERVDLAVIKSKLNAEEWVKFRDERQDRLRSSRNKIGELAYQNAADLRKLMAQS